jgi:hypothetical protein
MERSCHNIFYYTIPSFAWRNWKRATKKSVKITSLRAEIWTPGTPENDTGKLITPNYVRSSQSSRGDTLLRNVGNHLQVGDTNQKTISDILNKMNI